ncbi:MAG: BlaI/MecI/CopY family transcriptional regulator [Planctomycetes bacterium]|nr:BlaI/MecI/CopY family transcriptional regulator [Planctomycetota bacterium]
MPAAEPESLSRAEMKVMKLVWRLRRAAGREVVAAASEFNWQPSTVKTLLRRLVEKGHLHATRVGNSFLYEPVEQPVPALRRALDAVFEHVHDDLTAPLLAHLVKKSRLSDDEIAELRRLIDAKKGRSR